MKIFGALVLLAYAAIAFTGYEPFTTEERGKVPQEYRDRPGGLFLWHSGYHGGK